MGSTQGEIDFATRRALNLFDKWNDVTGFVNKHTSYYYEIQSCIEDAVLCGIQAGVGVHVPLDEEKYGAAETDVAAKTSNNSAMLEIALVLHEFINDSEDFLPYQLKRYLPRLDAVVAQLQQ